MTDLKKLQKEVYDNKVAKGFNTTDLAFEFCLAHEELCEAFAAYRKKLPDLGEELADVAIYLLGIAEIAGIDLESEILRKMEKNRNRKYEVINGVHVRVKEE
jgi:NTP pyrophosphatase (non-canonical NTP hydrolase)